MTKRILSLFAATAVLTAACGGDGGEGTVAQDTAISTVPSADTVDIPTVVPTQDTVVQTTTVEHDTIRGDAAVQGDTVVRP